MSTTIIADEQRSNLLQLADYLEKGALRAEFDMTFFNEQQFLGDHLLDCGSVGCAVGHGPYAGIPKSEDEDWHQYSTRAYGLPMHYDGFFPSNEWIWCFGGAWVRKDNTAAGAAARIRWLLDKGLPADWDEQLTEGDYPLCYKS